MVTDPIANMLIQIKNAGLAKKPAVSLPYSKIKMAIAKILQRQGFLAAVDEHGKVAHRLIVCKLAYTASGRSKITDLKRISKPSRRIYEQTSAIRPIRQGFGFAVLSTPKGILTDWEAKKEKVGGEVLFKVW